MGKSKFSYKKVIVIKLNRFEVVSGKYIEEISGQSRIGYSMSDTTDFYDMIEWSKKVGIKVQLFLFMITIMVKFMNHFKNRGMYYMAHLFI